MNRLFTEFEYRKFKESANVLELCQMEREKATKALGGGIKFSLNNPEYDKSYIRSYYLDKDNVWIKLT